MTKPQAINLDIATLLGRSLNQASSQVPVNISSPAVQAEKQPNNEQKLPEVLCTPIDDSVRIMGTYAKDLFMEAVTAILHYYQQRTPPSVTMAQKPPEYAKQAATFITLKYQGRLRGCIGTVEAQRPLLVDVMANAIGAAFMDRRFGELTLEEMTSDLTLSISLLSPKVERQFANEAELLGLLVPHKDGLVIEDQGKRAVFLPEVWDNMPEPKIFLSHLRAKAGMAPDHFSPSFKAWTYHSVKTIPHAFPAIKKHR